jgi:hypothetical protein
VYFPIKTPPKTQWKGVEVRDEEVVDSRTVEYEEPEIETTTTTYEVRVG